jgi:hypothetical protein
MTKVWRSPAPVVISPRLTSKTTTAEISGSGTGNVVASNALDVKISGSGTLTYSGNPQVSQTVSGSGKLIKK